jgi:ADP-ribosylglycohydrolase
LDSPYYIGLSDLSLFTALLFLISPPRCKSMAFPETSLHIAVMMTPAPNILLGSLIADSLALGPHWIYDPNEIREKFHRVTTYQVPLASYHAGKEAGDFTHYGDQTLVLLRSVVESKGFDLAHFITAWCNFWLDPATISYRDGATKTTLAHLQTGSPASTSHDISAVGRIGPLFLLEWKHEEELLTAARAVTAFTHGDPDVVHTAEFFSRVILAVQEGKTLQNALLHTPSRFEKQIVAALESAESKATDAEALQRYGLACGVGDAFPGICHLLLRYPEEPIPALIENVNAGGDSAARGMILGLVYGAKFPASVWPVEWLSDLKAYSEVVSSYQALRS